MIFARGCKADMLVVVIQLHDSNNMIKFEFIIVV